MIVAKIKKWEQECNFMAVPLNDFEVILGIKFFIPADVMVVPHLHKMFIMNEMDTCFVKAMSGKQDKKSLLQSANQLKFGLKMGKVTMFAALVKIEANKIIDVPYCVANLIFEYNDVMSPELPKTLPPQRHVNHQIELEPR